MEKYCELANAKVEHLYTVSNPCVDDHEFKDEELVTVGELSNVCSHSGRKCRSCHIWIRHGPNIQHGHTRTKQLDELLSKHT